MPAASKCETRKHINDIKAENKKGIVCFDLFVDNGINLDRNGK